MCLPHESSKPRPTRRVCSCTMRVDDGDGGVGGDDDGGGGDDGDDY